MKKTIGISRANRTIDVKRNICTKLLHIFEGPHVIDSQNNVNSYKLKYIIENRDKRIIPTTWGIYDILQISKFHN